MHNIAHKKLLKKAKINHPKIYNLINKNGLIENNSKPESELFLFLAKTVVGQQLSTLAAKSIWKKVEDLTLHRNCEIINLFASIDDVEIKGCGISKNKIRAIVELSNLIKTKELAAKTLLSSNHEEVIQIITSLWGFGNWSADMCAIFYCGLPDIYPTKDAAIIQSINKLCGTNEDPQHLFQTYSPYRSYLSRHLYIGLDSGYF